MIDRASARAGHYAVGDTITVLSAGRPGPFTVSGITGYGSADSFGRRIAGHIQPAHRPAAVRVGRQVRQHRREGGRRGPRLAAARPGRPVLPPGIAALTATSAAATQASQLNSQLSVLTTFFLAFAGVALFVGGFVIWNTFSIMIGQRTRELALLRAARRRARAGLRVGPR